MTSPSSNQGGSGYCRPPVATQFKKGQSGNPSGRPKGRKTSLPYDHVLGQMVTIREDGHEKRVTAAEAFLLQLTKKALEGDGPSMRAVLDALDRLGPRASEEDSIPKILRIIFSSPGVGGSIGPLGLAVKRHGRNKDLARWELRAWIVEAALGRFGKKRLTHDEQRVVWEASHRPTKINWPDWWSYDGG